MLVTTSALELELNDTGPLLLKVTIEGDDSRVIFESKTYLVKESRFIIEERCQIDLPLGMKSISVHVHAKKSNPEKLPKKISLRFFGTACIPVAGRVFSTPQAEMEKDIVRGRNQLVALRNENNREVGHTTFVMFVVQAPSPPKSLLVTSTRHDEAPSLVATELGKLLDILRKIKIHDNQLSLSLTLLELVRHDCSRRAFSRCKVEFLSTHAIQGNVIDDLVTQLISHSEFLRDVALPFIKGKQHSTRASGDSRLVLRYMQDMLIGLFDASVALFSWVHTYPVAAYKYFTGTADGLITHGFSVIKNTMERSSHHRYMALREMYPDLLLVVPNEAYPLEVRLVGKVLDEIVGGKSTMLANTLYSLRFIQAQGAMEEIQDKLKEHSNDGHSNKRDILRRMLTHIAQESDSLPSSLLVSVHLEAGSRFDAGSFGSIYRGRMLNSGGGGKVVALKEMPVYPRTGDTVRRLRQMYLEVLSCQSLSCRNVVKILGIYQNNQDVFIVMDYFQHGNTLNYRTKMCGVGSYRNGRLVDLIYKWMYELSVGLRYLHEEGIIHGDIRGVNLLVDNNENLLITDFGLSVFANGHSQQYLSRRTGNAQWMAPEIMERTQGISLRPTKASDTYAFSHTCIELFTGKAPYAQYTKDSRADVRDEIVFAKRRPSLPTIYDLNQPRRMSRDLYNLLTRCWNDGPEDRLTMDAVTRRLQAYEFVAIYSSSYHSKP